MYSSTVIVSVESGRGNFLSFEVLVTSPKETAFDGLRGADEGSELTATVLAAVGLKSRQFNISNSSPLESKKSGTSHDDAFELRFARGKLSRDDI
jgi:hypothetical protein